MMNDSPAFTYKETITILSDLNILIVDTDTNTLNSLDIFLSQYFKNIYTANNLKSAIDIIELNKPDLIITDYILSEINGTELISIAKKINPDIATILFTASYDLSAINVVNSGVDRFLQKPSTGKQLLEAIELSVNKIILKKILLERSNKELEIMRLKEKYHILQEEDAYKKQLNIIINYLSNSSNTEFFEYNKDFFYLKSIYKPFDILSGDCYSVRKISEDSFFIFLIDVMGKGLSASVTAITSTTYLNHIINQEIEILSQIKRYKRKKTSSLKFVNAPMHKFIYKFLKFIKPVLTEDEMLCGIFVYIDFSYDYISIVNFGMPPLLISINSELKEINANVLPITKFTNEFDFISFNISKIDKFLIYSDGIAEAKTSDGSTYLCKIVEDFKNSDTLKELEHKISKKIITIPDDSTIIFMRRFNIQGAFKIEFSIDSRIEAIDKFLLKFNERIKNTKFRYDIKGNIIAVLNELLMNAHEHGNLNIENELKDKLIGQDTYYDFVEKKEKNINMRINVKFVISFSRKELYIIVSDEGHGFEKHRIENREGAFFSKIGLSMTKSLSKDFFYNKKGNSIVVIMDIKNALPKIFRSNR